MTIAPIRIPAPDVVATQTATEYWQAKLDLFRDVNGRGPREDSDDMEERKVAKAVWGFNLTGACAPVPAPSAADAPSELATAAWHAKMHEYISWVKLHGRRPGPASVSNGERSLNQWLASQRRAARNGYLHEAFVLNLEGLEQVVQSYLPATPAQDSTAKTLELSLFLHTIGWDPDDAEAVFDSPEVRWSTNFNAAYDWCCLMLSQPLYAHGARERQLALWLKAERRAMDEGRLTPEKEQALRSLDTYPVRPTPSRPAATMAHAVVRWFERHDTLPNRAGSPVERVLSSWIHKQRKFHRDGTLSPEIAAILSATPHWLTARTGKTFGGEDVRKWRRALHEVAHWKETHGYLPLTRTGGGTEMRLSYWLQAQRDLHKAGRLRQEHVEALSALGPWFEGDVPERTIAFIQEHGRWPRPLAEDQVERSLGAAASLRRGEIIALGVPAQRPLRSQSDWEEKFSLLQSWVKVNGRLPKMRAPDKHESMLANFINVQRRNLAAGKLPEQREELLRTISGVLESGLKIRPVEEWKALVDTFIEEHGRIPRLYSSDACERSLAQARVRYGFGVKSRGPSLVAMSWQEKLDAHLLTHGALPRLGDADADVRALANARKCHRLAPRIPQTSKAAARQQIIDAYIEELRARK